MVDSKKSFYLCANDTNGLPLQDLLIQSIPIITNSKGDFHGADLGTLADVIYQ
jgi:hypothetical protein